MKTHLHVLTALVVALGFAGALPAAETDTTVTVTKTSNHHYVYYGDHQIYFAPETKTYYWQTSSTGPWQSGTTLPLESQGYVRNGGVEMDLDTERPYERHEWVVGHYRHIHDRDGNSEHEREHDHD